MINRSRTASSGPDPDALKPAPESALPEEPMPGGRGGALSAGPCFPYPFWGMTLFTSLIVLSRTELVTRPVHPSIAATAPRNGSSTVPVRSAR